MIHSSAALVEMAGVSREYAGSRPLRVISLVIAAGDRLVLSGLDTGAAEAFIYLVTGAALPDTGTVRVAGVDTRAIATDTEWLASLDRFGIVTSRAVLIDKLAVASNLALPITLEIEPMSPGTRAEVTLLADAAGLARDRLDAPVSALTPAERMRLHLARAMAMRPELVLLEHPTASIETADERASFGDTLRVAAVARGFGFLALSNDPEFAAGTGGRVMKLMEDGSLNETRSRKGRSRRKWRSRRDATARKWWTFWR